MHCLVDRVSAGPRQACNGNKAAGEKACMLATGQPEHPASGPRPATSALESESPRVFPPFFRSLPPFRRPCADICAISAVEIHLSGRARTRNCRPVPKTQIPDDQKRARPRRIRQAIRGPRSGRRLKGPGSTLFRVMKRVAPALVLALGLGWGQHAVGLCQHSQVCGCKRALTTHRFTTSLVASIFARYLAPIQAG